MASYTISKSTIHYAMNNKPITVNVHGIPIKSLSSHPFSITPHPHPFYLSAIPHTLDLVFTNEENMVTNLCYLPGLGNSDHVRLRFNLIYICYTQYYTQNSHHYNFNRADFLGMRDWLSSFDWSADFDSTDPQYVELLC